MTKHTTHFVVDAPGHYGDETRVSSSHHTASAAWRAAGKDGSLCVREGECVKGQHFHRNDERFYPFVATGDVGAVAS